jgi:peptide/nickel transport system ATP-binding protein
VTAVAGINLTFTPGKIIGIVGESGSGKSVTALTMLRLLPRNGRIERGRILLRRGQNMVDLAQLRPHDRTLNQIRGGDIAMIFQEPMAAFSPVHTIGAQLAETIRLHTDLPRTAVRAYGIDLLHRVGLNNPAQRFDQYAFELSGGMRQRAMIAIALAGSPRLLIADEPTTALDVTIQAQILDLLRQIQAETGMAIMFITHDLGVIAQLADEVAVMYLGKIVEYGERRDIFHQPRHPYTVNLLQAIVRSQRRGERLATIPGRIPGTFERPTGCPFHTRCTQAISGRCDQSEPRPTQVSARHHTACFLYE